MNLKENDARTFILFVQAADTVLKYSDAALNRVGLSGIRLMVLQVLDANGGAMTPSAIAHWTLREKHNITTLVRRLQQDGLVRIESSRIDKRSIKIVITDKGKQILRTTPPVSRSIMKQVMSSISDSSIAMLEDSLKTLRQNAYDGLQQINKRS